MPNDEGVPLVRPLFARPLSAYLHKRHLQYLLWAILSTQILVGGRLVHNGKQRNQARRED